MQKYIGTKIITAEPMTRQEYNDFRGWALPADERGGDPGYLVEYLDGGAPNVPGRAGYVSWSPAEQFDNAYRLTSGMPFGLAIEAMKKGCRVARAGWNGKGMWLGLVREGRYEIFDSEVKPPFSGDFAATAFLPWISMKTADEKLVPWLASQTDMLADDWQIVVE